MFTGIIEETGVVRGWQGEDRLRISCKTVLEGLKLGDSISVNGVCLTAVSFDSGGFEVDVSLETRSRSTLHNLAQGQKLNLERALLASGRLGGHFVLGHIDGIASLISKQKLGEYHRLEFQAPNSLAPLLVEKGSIALDGISLTLNQVVKAKFDVMIIPYTLESTNLGSLGIDDYVNIEVDILGKYIHKFLGPQTVNLKNHELQKTLVQSGFMEPRE